VDEMYRMLGREHQADLDREARKHDLASRLPSRRPGLTRQALTRFWRLATRRDARGANVVDAAGLRRRQPVYIDLPRRSFERLAARSERRPGHTTAKEEGVRQA
jgi:hypothetical protein